MIGNKCAVGNDGGRPRKVEIEDLPELGRLMVDEFTEHLETLEAHKMPLFFDGWARRHNLSDETIKRYSEDDKVFCAHAQHAKQIQKEILMIGGMKGYFNSQFTIFVAKNITDMRDRTELTGADGEPVKLDLNILGAITKVYADGN
jgi:hypothetical protein